MDERNDVTKLSPAEEDPVLHRYLAVLPEFSPGGLFEERVLAGVWRPDPEWMRNVRYALRDSIETGRIWLLVGAVTVGCLIPLAVLVGTGATFASEIGTGSTLLLERGIPAAWTAASEVIGRALSQVETFLGALPVSGGTLRAFALGSVPVLLGCAWGLSRTMRANAVRR